MTTIKDRMASFLRAGDDFQAKEDGATAIEYGLIAALLAMTIIGAVTSLGTTLSSQAVTVSTELENSR